MSDAMKTTVSNLEHEIQAFRAKVEKKGKTRITILIVLVIFVTGYMSYIKSLFGQVDTDAITGWIDTKARSTIVEHGPALRRQLVDNADGYVDALVKNITEQRPHELRAIAERELGKLTTTAANEFQEQLELILVETINKQMDMLHAHKPDLSNEERVRVIAEELFNNFNAFAKDMFDGMYDNYAHKLKQLDEYLAHLQVNHLEDQEEILHRDIIITWLALLDKKGTDDIVPGVDISKGEMPILDLFTKTE